MDSSNSIASFGTVDMIVFSGSLVLSLIVGLYYAIKDRKKESLDNYYFAGRNMSPIPVGLSIAVTFLSAVTIMTYPAELYLFGSVIAWFVFVSVVPTCLSCLYYLPIFMRLQISSIFEYLERRFDHRIRKIASVLTSLQTMLSMSLSIYAPSLALSAVTPLDLNLTILITSLVCTLYTTLGGMKAVVWTDTLQTLIMLIGVIACNIKAVSVAGGCGNVWDALERGGRLNAMNFNPDPTLRNSFWTIIAGCAISWSSPHQSVVQRWKSCGTVTKARLASTITTFFTGLFMLVGIINGAAMYAYFENCDPIESGKLEKPDQMLPYMVLEIFYDLPGMAGLFVSAAFSGTLSTVSSGINSVSSLMIEDLVLPCKPMLSNKKRMAVSKGLVFLLGIFATAFALTVRYLDRTLLQIGYSITGMLIGPLTGIFVLGMMLPWASTKGAVMGQIVGTAITGWIGIGGILYGKSANSALPTSTDCCSRNVTECSLGMSGLSANITLSTATLTVPITSTESAGGLATTIYAISFLYYSAISLIVTVSSGVIGSLITGANNPQDADPELFVPIISNPIFPQKIRKIFRFGVPLRCDIDADLEKVNEAPDSHHPLKSDDKEIDDVAKSKLL